VFENKKLETTHQPTFAAIRRWPYDLNRIFDIG
jgi:hypothetical protein